MKHLHTYSWGPGHAVAIMNENDVQIGRIELTDFAAATTLAKQLVDAWNHARSVEDENISLKSDRAAIAVTADMETALTRRCLEIADTIVPQYRADNGPSYSCTGVYAKRWQAAWDGACVALGGDPADYRS